MILHIRAAFFCTVAAISTVLAGELRADIPSSFASFESPQVHPLDVTPDGATLLVANTADDRLELFTLIAGMPTWRGSVPVGLEPVSVRVRDNATAWVVNLLSDSISVVDLPSMRVTRTVRVGDKPCDAVFAGAPQRAFVSLSQENRIVVLDPLNPGNLIASIPVAGEDPRALATDGTRVYAAIFESGNRTTILDFSVVSDLNGPYFGTNPPPNSGNNGFSPPMAQIFPLAPRVGQIVRRAADGRWMDDNNHDWSSKVTWNLHDHDVAVIDVAGLSVARYITDLMTLNMQLAMRPDGKVSVIGLEAINELRFEPNLNGRFIRVRMTDFPGAETTPTVRRFDLNPHLTYAGSSIPPAQRNQSIGDPRGVVWTAAGDKAFVAGMGSNNVVIVGADGQRLGAVTVGQGPTGVAMHPSLNRLYVLNRFDATVSVIDAAAQSELTRVTFFDPTPAVIRLGRPMLYDTHRTSGTGHVSCASCHIDGRTDALAWDLGNPAGAIKTFNQLCNNGTGNCGNWHPMKGPMTTQTLVGFSSAEPLHWRGDRENLAAFAPAFVSVLGDDAQPSAADMSAFDAFLATIRRGPNPNRNFNDTLRSDLTIDNGAVGNPAQGFQLFQTTLSMSAAGFTCVACHQPPAGSGANIISGPNLREPQSFKVAQLRDLFEKTGFDRARQDNGRGFGFLHDGINGTLIDFLDAGQFLFNNEQERLDVAAFLLSFSTGSHPSLGRQVTLDASNNQAGSAAILMVMEFMGYADQGMLGLVAKGPRSGQARGWRYAGGNLFQSDRFTEQVTFETLRVAVAVGSELTFTLVPAGTELRVGCDRDEDGYFDRDETDYCSDPADAASLPRLKGDMDLSGTVNAADIAPFVALLLQPGPAMGEQRCLADVNRDDRLDGDDLQGFIACLNGQCGGPPQGGIPSAAVSTLSSGGTASPGATPLPAPLSISIGDERSYRAARHDLHETGH